MERMSNSRDHETDWLALSEAVERVHSLPSTDGFDTLLREERLRETTRVSPPRTPEGVCIHESLLENSNLSGLFRSPNITLENFTLVIDTFKDNETVIQGEFLANGVRYQIGQHGDMILLTEANLPELPGFAIEQDDIKRLLYAQIAVLCDQQPDTLDSVLSAITSDANEVTVLHDTALALGHVVGSSTHTTRAVFKHEDEGRALFIQYSESETPYQSEQSNQLDIGYLPTPDTYASGELITFERAVPDDDTMNVSSYEGVMAPTDKEPVTFIEDVLLHGRIDTFDALLGNRVSYPATEKKDGVAYAELCQELLAVVTPKLIEIEQRLG